MSDRIFTFESAEVVHGVDDTVIADAPPGCCIADPGDSRLAHFQPCGLHEQGHGLIK